MKNNIKIWSLFLTALVLFTACSDEFLEVEPTGRALEDNYYRNAEEAYNGLVAAYDPVGWSSGDYVTKMFAMNAASDDFYAGGGNAQDITNVQVINNYTVNASQGPQGSLWAKGFSGIFRANTLLVKLPEVEMDSDLKTRFEAEGQFLRAFYYFDLIRFFYEVPLFTEPVDPDQMYQVEQVPADQVYDQIEADLIAAIPNLPVTVPRSTEAGRATQGAARALLGKVYLWREKYDLAAQQFAEVNGTPGGVSQYGYELLDNFADLFDSENKFNSEGIFEVSHTAKSNGVWDCIGCTEGFLLNIMTAPRAYNLLMPGQGPDYVSGWSFLPVTQDLVDQYDLGGGVFDNRYSATISNIDSLEQAGVLTYEKGYQNTGYFLHKYAGRQSDVTTGGGNYELNFFQNEYEIRLADTYLLEAESLLRSGGNATRAQALLDAVRTRAGMPAIPATLDNIMQERRLELAGEGHRWFDLVRTGQAPTVLASQGFVAGKHEKLPIPLLELTNTMIEQDPAYN